MKFAITYYTNFNIINNQYYHHKKITKNLHTTHGVAIESQCPRRRLHKFPFFSAPFNKRLSITDPISACPCYSNLLHIAITFFIILYILYSHTDTHTFMCAFPEEYQSKERFQAGMRRNIFCTDMLQE